MALTEKKRQALIKWLESMPWWDELPYSQLEAKNKELREALEEQLGLRGYAYRGRCDGVPEDVRRAFIAIGTPCDEIDKQVLEAKGE